MSNPITPFENLEVGSHHDEFRGVVSEIRKMPEYERWVAIVRKERENHEWTPNHIDITKSRLFWWIRSGREPLPHRPPTAYSCPWYEVVVEHSTNHSCFELSIWKDWPLKGSPDVAGIAQCPYSIIERISDTELIVGYGPYRFRAFRDEEMEIDRLRNINPHIVDDFNPISGEKEDWSHARAITSSWFIRRELDLEQP